ncbi:MAG: TRAP transporter large permease subunit, partial [bacterium]
MLANTLSFLVKLGIVAEGMAKPRQIEGLPRVLVSVIAVGFSYFFIHISFFGPPISEYFKGTYILATAMLCILVYKGRQNPVREGFSWLDEIFLFITHTVMCAVFALWAYWELFDRSNLWSDLNGASAALAALAGAILGAALYWREATREKIPETLLLSDWLYLLSATAPIIWWVIKNVDLVERVGGPVPTSVVIFSGLLAAVSFEIARRVVGPVIPLIGFFFLIYTFKPIAQISPGILFHDGFGLARVAEFLMLEADGMTGLIVEVFATYIVIFVVLGAFLEKTGLGEILIDTTFRLTGHTTGGPGLTAVVSSGLFGMVSGSGVANVVTTGTFTIPLMKRVGYRSEFAAAVEAAASTGGAYMPPIMAGAAFLIAQLTETSYFEIIKVALLPAILYYASLAYMVYIRAVHRGLIGVSADELPPWRQILLRLHFLLPIPVMVYFLMIGDSAFLAAFKTIC